MVSASALENKISTKPKELSILGFGSDISDVVHVTGLKRGPLYRADFEGVAIGLLTGTKYIIIDNAHITFTY